jgi:NADH-quinone oxidoreductase subunit E
MPIAPNRRWWRRNNEHGLTQGNSPNGKMPGMNASERIQAGGNARMTQEIAGMANLWAHPLASIAAANAIGLGLATQALGFWMGAFAGAAEASQKYVAPRTPADAPTPKPATSLKLVVSRPATARKAVAAKQAAEEITVPAQPKAASKPVTPDDLKAISGIGPKLVKVLNARGIWTYGQIAALSGAEIALLDEQLGFAGRIGRDDWVGQAKALLKDA